MPQRPDDKEASGTTATGSAGRGLDLPARMVPSREAVRCLRRAYLASTESVLLHEALKTAPVEPCVSRGQRHVATMRG